MIKNAVKHFVLVTKHRWLVFKLCARIGIPYRGLIHDLSKYSPTEFFESVKYFNGSKSPILLCKQDKGYSDAWLHHKGRNKHHTEYWVDINAKNKTPIIPYKFTAEMICDKLAACITYNGKNYKPDSMIKYWEVEREMIQINMQVSQLLTKVFEEVRDNGINETLTKRNIQNLYIEYCGVKKNENKI